MVSGFFKEGATDTAADKMMKVLEAEAAAGYVERWEQIKDGNYGLLLWGRVGTCLLYTSIWI